MTLARATSSLPPDLEQLIHDTIGGCLEVHKALGPGLPEAAYARALRIELRFRGIRFDAEKTIAVRYRGELVAHQRIDLMVDRRLVLEVKSVEQIHPVHVAQTVTYVRLSGARAGLVVNFNVALLKDGIKRVVV